MENGKEVSRNVISEQILRDKQDKVVLLERKHVADTGSFPWE